MSEVAIPKIHSQTSGVPIPSASSSEDSDDPLLDNRHSSKEYRDAANGTCKCRPSKLAIILIITSLLLVTVTTTELVYGLRLQVLVLIADAMVSYIDISSYIVNIIAEFMSQGNFAERYLARIDLGASILSLLLLVASTTGCVYMATRTLQHYDGDKDFDSNVVLAISSVGISIDVIALITVLCQRKENNLNTFSFLMHILVDFVRGLAQIGVGVAVIISGKQINHAHIDAVGTLVHSGASLFAICLLIYAIISDVRKRRNRVREYAD